MCVCVCVCIYICKVIYMEKQSLSILTQCLKVHTNSSFLPI